MNCIYCGNKTKKSGKLKDEQRYQCCECNKTFTKKTLEKNNNREETYKKIKKMYLEDNMSTTEIGKIMGVSSTIPQRILKSMGITRSISESKKGKKKGTKLPINKIIQLYKSGLSSLKVAEDIGCSKRSVLNILKNNNISRDNTYSRLNPKIDDIEKLYIDGYSMLNIAQELGISYSAVNNNLHKLGIVRSENKYGIGMDYTEYLEKLSELEKYKSDVYKITSKQDLKKLPNYNKRGLAGVDGAYHLDHKYSILEGFKNNVKPKVIGDISNLEFIPWIENIRKKDKNSITLKNLIGVVNG